MASATLEKPCDQNLMAIGIFGRVHLLDKTVVRKVPRNTDTQPILNEATIYTILGDHPRIANCLSKGEIGIGYVDIEYYPNGDLLSYLKKNEGSISDSLRRLWFRQIIEAIEKIHQHNVIHSDLSLRQFFLDNDLNVRLGDFNSAQYPGQPALGYEKATHCLPRDYEAPNTIRSDLFALGSTLYELATGRFPYSQHYPDEAPVSDPVVRKAQIDRQRKADGYVEALYAKNIFPDLSTILGRDVILGCWKGEFLSAKDILARYDELVPEFEH